MRVSQISSHDLTGRIFNGHELQIALNQKGILARQYVMEKEGSDCNTLTLNIDRDISKQIKMLETKLSMGPLLYSNRARLIENDSFYRNSDIVHFHLFYDKMISLFDFVRMVQAKPSVWTIHDIWPLTGHCIHPKYPKSCESWRTGCDSCPDIQRYFPMKEDKAGQMWRIKKRLYQRIDPDIVVSTEWLEQYVRESPLTQHFTKIHRIPFGIHLERYNQRSKGEARHRLNIPSDAFVIAFRTDGSPAYRIKGSTYIWEALQGIESDITLLTVGWGAVPEDLCGKFHTVQLGWRNDDEIMADFYSACDIFLMPSLAETFGLMAIEAMASARPVIIFEDTVLTSVTFAPDCGVAVPYKDSNGLRGAICRLKDNPEERVSRGELGRQLAEKFYRFEDYVDRHIALYQDILDRNGLDVFRR